MRLKVIIGIFILGLAQQALASNKISSPNVKEGQLGLEYRGGYDFDDARSKDGAQLHKFVMNYGVTDRFRPEMKLLYLDPAMGDSKISGMEFSLRLQVFKPSEAWLATSIETYYKPSFIAGYAGELEQRILAEKVVGKVVTTGYFAMENEIGENRHSGITLTAATESHYKWTSSFQPGIEFYTDIKRLDGKRRHQIGPVISGNITPQWKYETGYLFGASGATTDGRAKLILSYEWQF